MKIVHIAPSAPYNDYWGYQDNLLPKYQKKLGHDVTIITTNTIHKAGEIIEVDSADYVLNDGVRVIRLARKQYIHPILTNLNSRLDIKKYLNEISPAFIFFHGLVSTTIYDVIQYKKRHPNCVIVQDNHLDYNIGRSSTTWKDRAIRLFYRHINRKSIPYVSRVYGVTPWRKTYAEEYFNIPKCKTDVLLMGADDENINYLHRKKIRSKIRDNHNIAGSDFLIVTGGKIDAKKNIHRLMGACAGMDGVKLLIFGELDDDIREEFDRLCTISANILYVGWIAAEKVYDYFFAADLVFFPGRHSVLWEQACASKTPCVFYKWDEMNHVNNGGNSDFIYSANEITIRQKITELKFTSKYYAMKMVAESEATDIYLYSNIAKKSLECIQ